MHRKILFLLLLGSVFCGVAPAWSASDTLYVNDKLRVGVRPEPDTRSTPVGVVVTGMKLEVLGQSNGYIQIRTDKGLSGWIRDIYVTETPPAMIKLEQIQEQRESTVSELQELRENNRVLEEANTRLNEQLDQVRAERARLQLRLAHSASESKTTAHTWIYWLLGLLIGISAAFSGGMYWQRRQTTRRLGGLRI